jgi:hypothetical protein
MSYVFSDTVSLTTDSSGDATGYSEVVTGIVDRIIYTKDDFADGVDFTITIEETGESLWTESDVNASATRSPHQKAHATDGTEFLYASGGEPVIDAIGIANSRVKFVVANGGSLKSGSFTLVMH